jgi:cyclophilin family peptidyl-prolyl cis-trans isomerase
MEQTSYTQTPIQKIYKDKAIRVATFIGGPLVAGYLIAENFKVFNEPEKAKKAWIYTIIATVVIFGSIFLIPNSNKSSTPIIPLIYTWIAYYLVIHYQGESIKVHINGGGQTYNWGRTLGIGLIGLVITIIPIFGIVYFTDVAANTGTIKTYGVIKNEIHFDKSNISAHEIDEIANGLKTITFFDETVKKDVYVKKVKDNYEISIACSKSVEGNTAAVAIFVQLRDNMQKTFSHNQIVFNLVVDSLDNVVKRIE